MTEDPRQARTRQALSDALRRLLAARPLGEISVAALCREAGVHRTTFYGHAQGVEDLLVDLIGREIDQAATVDVPAEMALPDAAARYTGALGQLLDRVAAERPLFRSLLSSSSRGLLLAALERDLRVRVRLALDVFGVRDVTGTPAAPAREEAAAFVAGALVGFIDVWAHEDDSDSAAAARRVLGLMPAWWPLR